MTSFYIIGMTALNVISVNQIKLMILVPKLQKCST